MENESRNLTEATRRYFNECTAYSSRIMPDSKEYEIRNRCGDMARELVKREIDGLAGSKLGYFAKKAKDAVREGLDYI